MKKDNIVLPDYENSILNLINSILHYYHVETKYKGIDVLDKRLERKYKNIVLIILDGMGENILNTFKYAKIIDVKDYDLIGEIVK